MKTPEIPETAERFVVYFDVMGFKDFVYRNDHSTVSELMNKLCSHIGDAKKWFCSGENGNVPDSDFEKILPVMFSDTVLFITNGNTIKDARSAMLTAAAFLHDMFKKGIPVKGALSYGTFSIDINKSMFFGRPLIDAYLLAEETYFYGSVIHHTAEVKFDEFDDDFLKKIVSRSQIPMKKGMVMHSYADWTVALDNSLEDLINPLYKTVSGNIRRYVDNTMSTYIKNS